MLLMRILTHCDMRCSRGLAGWLSRMGANAAWSSLANALLALLSMICVCSLFYVAQKPLQALQEREINVL